MYIFLIIISVLLILNLTRKTVSFNKKFQANLIGNNVENYINSSESKNPNVLPWAKKKIIWHDSNSKSKTKIAIIYVHGFSASLGEIRPVPDVIAKNYCANLFYTRLSGHGMNNTSVLKKIDGRDWYLDVQEAFEVGREIGEKIIVIASSFGCTLVAEYLSKNQSNDKILANVFISPCFGISDWKIKFCRFTWSKFIFNYFFGESRIIHSRNSDKKKWWTFTMPIESYINLEISVEKIWKSDFSKIFTPAIFIFNLKDTIISIPRLKKASLKWGGTTSLVTLDIKKGIDNRNMHVILGSIKNPELTPLGIEIIMSWLNNFTKSG